MLFSVLLQACVTSPFDSAESDDTTLRQLDTCSSSFGDGVPAFYTTYFRCVDVSVDGDDLVLASTDLPPHPSPYYETASENWEAWDDRGGEYHQNPNTLTAQAFVLRIPSAPVAKGIVVTEDMRDLTMLTSLDEFPGGTIGIALDGVSLYNATAAPGDDIREEQYTFDTWSAHPSPDGAYHHHSPNPGGLAVLEANGLVSTHVPGEAEIELYGIACDGTVVLGCTELDGGAVATEELDAQGGHVGDLRGADGTLHFAVRYHTHMCAAIDADAFTPEIQYYNRCTVSSAVAP